MSDRRRRQSGGSASAAVFDAAVSGSRCEGLMIITAWAITGLCCVYYLFLITNGDFNLVAREHYTAIFDRMAWNLLHWRFTIEPEIVQDEAFLWKGQTYSYFGMLPAILR